jgi:hypothetical protein
MSAPAQLHEPENPLGGVFDGDSACFEEMSLTRGDLRIVWEWLGEGYDGDWDPEDDKDTPLLRFSVYRRIDDPAARDELGLAVNEPWAAIDDASYCTNMPLVAEVPVLRAALELMMNGVESDFEPGDPDSSCKIKRTCEDLSWINPGSVEGCSTRKSAATLALIDGGDGLPARFRLLLHGGLERQHAVQA